MEFLRLGSSIPGSYWGCCAFDYIQCFDRKPDDPASIELVYGDSGQPLVDYNRGNVLVFAGKTYEDIFWQRLRYGTMGKEDMPNHGFLATLTRQQLNGPWLPILKKAGFEFIRTVDNSVYTGSSLNTGSYEDCDDDGVWNDDTQEYDFPDKGPEHCSSHPVYLFALFRNVSDSSIEDPYKAPQRWQDLPDVVPEAWQTIPDTVTLSIDSKNAQIGLYKALPDTKYYTEEELVAANVPVTVAGRRSDNPQEPKRLRDDRQKAKEKSDTTAAAPTISPAWFTKIPEAVAM